MFLSRRPLLLASAALAATALVQPTRAQENRRYRAVAFDGFVIIDPRPVAARAEEMFPGRGDALMEAWRTRQFEYTWLRTLAGRYAGFAQVTRDALIVAAKAVGLDLPNAKRDRLLATFGELKAWPDVGPALREIKAHGIRMAFLANPPDRMFDAVVRNSGLEGLLDRHLSTDRVQLYKPHPRAYQMGVDAFHQPREAIVFAASAAWDAAGAKAFGYPTFWVNRGGLPLEELGAVPDAIGSSTADLVKFVAG
jgi:2-haloacid dehalogenase